MFILFLVIDCVKQIKQGRTRSFNKEAYDSIFKFMLLFIANKFNGIKGVLL